MNVGQKIASARKVLGKHELASFKVATHAEQSRRICVELLDGSIYHPATKTWGLCPEPILVRIRDMFAVHIRESDNQPGRPTKAQEEFCSDMAPYLAMLAGVGSGKSAGGAVADIQDALTNPASQILVGAPSHASLWENCIQAIEKILSHPMFAWLVVKPRIPHQEGKCGREQHRIYKIRLINKSTIVFRSMEHRSSANKRIQGPTYSGGRLEEASSMPVATWNYAVERIRDQSGLRMQLRVTSSLDKPGWLERKFLHPKVDRNFFHTVKGKTQAADFRGPQYLANLKASMPTFLFRRKVEAQLLYESGRVYGDRYWSQEADHPGWIDHTPSGKRVIFGVDFGYRKPYVIFAEEAQIEDRTCLVLLDEIVTTDITMRGLGRLIQRKAKEEGWRLDRGFTDYSSTSETDRDHMAAVLDGVKLYPAIWPGREKYWRVPQGCDLARTLCEPENRRIYASRKLFDTDYNSVEVVGFYGMIGGYHYREHEEGQPLAGVPVKDGIHDHPADGYRYLVLAWAADADEPGLPEAQDDEDDRRRAQEDGDYY